MAVGTIYGRSRDGLTPYLPARYTLQLPPLLELVLDARWPGNLHVGGSGRSVPRSMRYLGLEPGIDVYRLLEALCAQRHRIKTFDLSHLRPEDVSMPVVLPSRRRLRVKELLAPTWMTAGQAGDLRKALSARTLLAEAPRMAPPALRGDREAMLTLIATSVAQNPGVPAPDSADLAVTLADTYRDVGRPAMALAVLAPWIAAENYRAFIAAAAALKALGSPWAAVAACEAAVACSSDPSEALTDRADILRLNRHPGQAVLAIEDVLRGVPNSVYALVVMGYSYTQCNQFRAAAAVERRLVDLAPTDRRTHYLGAVIRSHSVGPVGSGVVLLASRWGQARAREKIWTNFLTSWPGDLDGMKKLTAVQRAARPWSPDWVNTHLGVVDRVGADSEEAKQLSTLVAKVPGRISILVAFLVWLAWLLLILSRALPPESFGWPLAGGSIAGLAVAAIIRLRIPRRARLAAAALNGRRRRGFRTLAMLVAGGITLIATGSAIVHPDTSCDNARPDCPVSIPWTPPPTFKMPTFAPPTFNLPTFAPPTFTVPDLTPPTAR